jgi:hypothetical protein
LKTRQIARRALQFFRIPARDENGAPDSEKAFG